MSCRRIQRRKELLSLVEQLNQSRDVHGILFSFRCQSRLMKIKLLRPLLRPRMSDFSSSECRRFEHRPAGLCLLHAGRDHPAFLKRSGIEIDGKECVIVGRSNIVGETDGFTSPERKRHSDCLSFPYEEFKGCLQTGGYSCGCHRQTEILQS